MTKHGIDISKWQGEIDFAKVKDQVDFIILRAGFGKFATQKDERFEQYYAECQKYGIPCGAYWYGYAATEKDAKEEANACLECIKNKTFQYPVYYDVEEKAMLGSGNIDNIISAFCKSLEAAKVFAGLYMSRSPLMAYVSLTVRNRFALWVAEYGSKCNYNGDYGMWQKSSEGRIDGINGNVDLDVCYIDYPSIIKGSAPADAVKKTIKVELEIDDHKYSGLLTEN